MAIKKVVSATRAVAFALAQVGKGYAWAGTGPKFDCSGLVMMAWEQGGVAMPHNSAAQADYHQNPYVTTVPATAANKRRLVPGDLVFYYPGITHVGMYIGGGQIVNAENPSVGVIVTGVNVMPYEGARRPG